MNIFKSIAELNKTQKIIWITSLIMIAASFIAAGSSDYLTVIASLIGATALIFIGKGDALGQLLTIIFALIYAVISFKCRYYGEMITYVGMTLPSAAVAMVNWIKNPYAEREVKVAHVSKMNWIFLAITSVLVTAIMGEVLEYFNTANLFFSTLSVTTSYFASMLMIFRSPYYAVAYSFNDVILIILWVLATIESISYLPMVICFVVFLVNDVYGFVSWQSMKHRQSNGMEDVYE